MPSHRIEVDDDGAVWVREVYPRFAPDPDRIPLIGPDGEGSGSGWGQSFAAPSIKQGNVTQDSVSPTWRVWELNGLVVVRYWLDFALAGQSGGTHTVALELEEGVNLPAVGPSVGNVNPDGAGYINNNGTIATGNPSLTGFTDGLGELWFRGTAGAIFQTQLSASGGAISGTFSYEALDA